MLAAIVAATAAAAGQRAADNVLSAAERQAGWRLLFDGQSLHGWQAYDPALDPAKGWRVENGCLRSVSSDGTPASSGGDIVTVDRFSDFDVQFDWRITTRDTGNSGVKYFVRERTSRAALWPGDDGQSAIGHEYQIIDDAKQTETALGATGMTGALYALVAPNAQRKVRPIGQFNSSRIVVKGRHVEHWLNGVQIVTYELDSPALLSAVQQSKFKPVPHFGSKTPTRILLQDHGSEVWFKNVKIRAL